MAPFDADPRSMALLAAAQGCAVLIPAPPGDPADDDPDPDMAEAERWLAGKGNVPTRDPEA